MHINNSEIFYEMYEKASSFHSLTHFAYSFMWHMLFIDNK